MQNPMPSPSSEIVDLMAALARKDEERAAIMRRLEMVLGMKSEKEQRKRRTLSRSEFSRRCGL